MLSSNDNKRIQTFDKAIKFPQETSTIKVFENEMLIVLKAKGTLKILNKECGNILYVTCNILNYIKANCSRVIKNYVEINLKKYVKKYEKIEAPAAFNVQIINFDDYKNENRTERNKNWPYIPDKPCRY